MFSDMINNQWLWLGAAGALIVLFGLLLILHRARRRSSEAAGQQQNDEGWRPTGRIDFVGPSDASSSLFGSFVLQAEDSRVVSSVGGLDHHEIRWRKATLKEAKTVVKVYHTELKLAITAKPTASPLPSSATESGLPNEGNDPSLGSIDSGDDKLEG